MSEEIAIVTVGVLCYNAEKTVDETLNSIKNQTFKRLNLIINDDASNDDSLQVINKWVKDNRDRFDNVEVHSQNENKGINWSFDYLMRICKTKWIKPIASDDILMDDCIEKNVNYIVLNNIDTMLLSGYVPFTTVDGKNEGQKKDLYELKYARKICRYKACKQYEKLLIRDIQFSSTVFMNCKLYVNFGGITLEIKNIEDWPLRLLYTKNGAKIHFMNMDTVYYRIGNSVSHDTANMYNKRHIEQSFLAKRMLAYPNISRAHILYYFSEFIEQYRYKIIIEKYNNEINYRTKTINFILKTLELNRLPERIYKELHK